MICFFRRANAVVEYSILLALAAAAFVGIKDTVRRGVQVRIGQESKTYLGDELMLSDSEVKQFQVSRRIQYQNRREYEGQGQGSVSSDAWVLTNTDRTQKTRDAIDYGKKPPDIKYPKIFYRRWHDDPDRWPVQDK